MQMLGVLIIMGYIVLYELVFVKFSLNGRKQLKWIRLIFIALSILSLFVDYRYNPLTSKNEMILNTPNDFCEFIYLGVNIILIFVSESIISIYKSLREDENLEVK